MATRSDDLAARRKAALSGKSKTVPTIEQLIDQDDAIQPQSSGQHVNGGPAAGISGGMDGGYVATTSSGAPGRGIQLPMAPDVDLTREVDQSDLIMPKLKICQAMSKVSRSGIPQGHYYHSTLNDDLGTTIKIIPVDMRKSRSLFKQGVGIVCRSFDLLQGEGDPGLLCEGTPEERRTLPASARGCPLRRWGERNPETGKSAPPPCGLNYNYPVLILDPDDPENGPTKRAIISFRGTGSQVAKAINSMVTEQDLVWNESVIELSTEETTNWKGTFFVPRAKFVGIASGMAATRAQRFAETVNATSVRASVEADEDDE